MAADIFGNEVGDYIVIDSREAEIQTDQGSAKALNASIQYTKPVQPVATFGADVVYAFRQPQGSLTLGYMAGDSNFLTTISGSNCKGSDLRVTFGNESTCTLNGRNLHTYRGVQCVGTIFNQFSIQGTAQDAFFTENVGAFFHYLTKA